jgi:hypothetical protein
MKVFTKIKDIIMGKKDKIKEAPKVEKSTPKDEAKEIATLMAGLPLHVQTYMKPKLEAAAEPQTEQGVAVKAQLYKEVRVLAKVHSK